MTEPTADAAPAEWPESVVRNNFPFDDYRTISGHWTEWAEPTRRVFADLVATTRPSAAATAIVDFLADNDPTRLATASAPEPPLAPVAPEPAPVVVPEPVPVVVPPPVVVQNNRVVAPAELPVDPPAPDPSSSVSVPPAAARPESGQQPAGDDGQAERVYAALRTGATAKVWAEDHPGDVAAMIAYEAGDDGKGRKSVLAALRDLQAKTRGE